MTKNLYFREFKCGLSIKQTAELCFKSVKTVTLWDKGKPIPPECKRLMRMVSGRELSNQKSWDDFEMVHDKLITPTGQKASPQEIIIGLSLLDISTEDELRVIRNILKISMAISRIKILEI